MKKQVVANHAYRCKRQIDVSCMDCLKDFPGQEYVAHTVCISEAEKYSAKGFVEKEKKGAKKQENWITMVRTIPQRNKNLSSGVKSVFDVINRNENIPRKGKGFINFFYNSHRHIAKRDVEQAWAIIEQELKSEKPTAAQQNGQNTEPSVPTKNGTSGPVQNGEVQKPEAETEPTPTKQKKRKTEDTTAENGQEEVEESRQSTKQKKRQKTKDSPANGHEDDAALLANETSETNGTDATNGEQEKFLWSKVIRELLASKNNQMKLSKLKKKVMKRYQQTTGSSSSDTDGKFEKMFQKKIAKNGFVVENDTVRLVEKI